MTSKRRVAVVLVLLAVLVVVLGLLGSLGAARQSGRPLAVPSLPQRQVGGQVKAEDVDVRSATCSRAGRTFVFTGGCELVVGPSDSPWPWQDATRRALLVVESEAVRVDMTVGEERVGDTLGPGESVRLVATREGGTIVLGCLGVTTPCTVHLEEDRP